jgi:hypothetical protein
MYPEDQPQQPPTPTGQPPAQPPAQDDSARVAELERQVAELREQAQPPKGNTVGIPEPPSDLDFDEWPKEGGLGEDHPQPWDLKAQGLQVGNANDGTTTIAAPHTGDVTVLEPGAPDTVSPVVVSHNRPLLGPLSSDPSVAELGAMLAKVGIETSVSRGENPNNVVDESVLAGVERFRDAYDVQEDPSQWPVQGKEQSRLHIGPWTWEAIQRAAARVEA